VTIARGVSCSAERQEGSKQLGTAVAALALTAAFGFGAVEPAKADVAGLTPCSESKAYAKRKKNEVKGLTKRLKQVSISSRYIVDNLLQDLNYTTHSFPPSSFPLSPPPSLSPPRLSHLPHPIPSPFPLQYEEGSAPALALKATIEKTERRFDNYAKQGLLCGTDGLPHLIADPGLALRYGHAGDVLYPTVGFIYFAGWIGYAGTKYVQAIRKEAKPTEKEIIIDVPLAWKLLWAGLAWPVAALAEFRNDTLLEKDSNITISPR